MTQEGMGDKRRTKGDLKLGGGVEVLYSTKRMGEGWIELADS